MANIITFLFAVNGLLISIFVGYHLFFVILYPFVKWKKRKQPKTAQNTKYNKFAIIIPAHNEEILIGDVLQSTKKLHYPSDKYEVIVIADNCTDRTAKIVRYMSIKCFERNNLEEKGKPYALKWIFKQISIDEYNAFVILDADTLIDNDFLAVMNQKLSQGAHIIQGYFGIMNREDTWVTRLSVIPGILKFKIRYLCKEFLGLSCPLMGNGMCFSRKIIKEYGWNAFSITENWEYYIKLILKNHISTYAEDAIIYSQAVISLKYGEIQRKRWLKGRLQTAIDYFPKLILTGLKENSMSKMDAAMELLLPSYSMLFNWTILSLLVVIPLWILRLQSFNILAWLMFLSVVQFLFFILGLIIAKASFKTWMSLCYVPIFLGWKFIVTIKGIFGFKNRVWTKTERS
jgi:cellulose synthase/poly-beta-1,6-N-acetylglucosamine synthase-like glycosyltransferase